ncbi:hypothetical protein [Granulosicoccus antarcticus]|nr:hypothetical protein [Granulosicoccus antarcticus]
MSTKLLTKAVAVSLMLTLVACSDNDDSDNGSSDFNPDLDSNITPGIPGGDTTSIAGLWDGSTTVDEVENTVYWNIASNGVLTRYDYQQDGTADSSGENCYVIGDPITLTPEGGDSYSIADVASTIVRSDDNLTVTLAEEDKNDLDEDGDVTENLTLDLTLLTTPTLADLNSCSSEEAAPETDEETGNDSPNLDDQAGSGLPSFGADRPTMSTLDCEYEGGTIVGDIGDGSINDADYRCESGQSPIANILDPDGVPVHTEGAVCCV